MLDDAVSVVASLDGAAEGKLTLGLVVVDVPAVPVAAKPEDAGSMGAELPAVTARTTADVSGAASVTGFGPAAEWEHAERPTVQVTTVNSRRNQ